jgi:hypothetical protein
MGNSTSPLLTSTTTALASVTWSGREVAYFLRDASELRRTTFATGLVTGEFQVTKFTEQAAAQLCGVSVFHLRKALGKTPNGRSRASKSGGEVN